MNHLLMNKWHQESRKHVQLCCNNTLIFGKFFLQLGDPIITLSNNIHLLFQDTSLMSNGLVQFIMQGMGLLHKNSKARKGQFSG
jgi:hypothetical protein